MSEPRPPKKSETIEVRIPHPTKAAFMDKARAEGRPASDIVREQINAYLTGPVAPKTLWSAARRYLGAILAVPVLLGGVLALVGASAPAAAQPELKQAFATMDTNRDDRLSRDEFVLPSSAHEIDIRGVQPGFDGALAIGNGSNAGAYVRFLLLGPEGDVPLLITVDKPPPGKIDDARLAQLVGKTFDRLDRNSDGMLAQGEFLAR